MKKPILFIYLYSDESNSVSSLIRIIEKEVGENFFESAGVVRLARNTYLLDATSAHAPLVLLCAEAQNRGRPYLLVPLDSDASLLVGQPEENIQNILENFGVPSTALARNR